MKALAHPHSVDSIPTSGDQEDYVSMGMSAARRLRRMLDALCNVISIEFLAAAQGIDFHAPLQTGTESRKAYALVRSVSPVVAKDRALAPDIAAVVEKIAAGEFQKVIR
jgi:histidine ammonia-lyase